MDYGRIGRRIRAFRKLKRIQQVEFASKIGISASNLGQIERGLRKVNEEQLQKVADELNIDIKELVGEE